MNNEQQARELVAKLANDVIDDMAAERRAWRESLPPDKQLEVMWLVWEGRYLEVESLYRGAKENGAWH
jgi:hypothetical protein